MPAMQSSDSPEAVRRVVWEVSWYEGLKAFGPAGEAPGRIAGGPNLRRRVSESTRRKILLKVFRDEP